MSDRHENDVNLIQLRAEVDAEISYVETIADPTDITDPDTAAYDIRLHVLRDAIEANAIYVEKGVVRQSVVAPRSPGIDLSQIDR